MKAPLVALTSLLFMTTGLSAQAETACPFDISGVKIGMNTAQIAETLSDDGLKALEQTRKAKMNGTLIFDNSIKWPPEGVVLTREQQGAVRKHDARPELFPWPEDVPPRPAPGTQIVFELILGRNSVGPLGAVRVTRIYPAYDETSTPSSWGDTALASAIKKRWESFCSNGAEGCVYNQTAGTTKFTITAKAPGCYYHMSAGINTMHERIAVAP